MSEVLLTFQKHKIDNLEFNGVENDIPAIVDKHGIDTIDRPRDYFVKRCVKEKITFLILFLCS